MNKHRNQTKPGVSRALRLLFPALSSWAVVAMAATQTLNLGMLCLLCCAVFLCVWGAGSVVIFCFTSQRARRTFGLHWARGCVTQFSIIVCLCSIMLTQLHLVGVANSVAMQPANGSPTEPSERLVRVFGVEKQTSAGGSMVVRVPVIDEQTGAKISLTVAGYGAPIINGIKFRVFGIPQSGKTKYEPLRMTANKIQEIEPESLVDKAYLWIGTYRMLLRHSAEKIPAAELVPGFAIGDTNGVSLNTQSNMKESGLTHLTAVSGANCALIIQAAYSFAARIRLGWRSRIMFAGFLLLGFAMLVGPDASVLRATVMALVMLLSRFGGRRVIGFNNLALAIIILLIFDPLMAVSAGFTLSVLATLGILALAEPIERAIRRRIKVLPGFLLLPITVTLAANIACTPFLITVQSGISIAGIVANVVAEPLAPLATVLGLFAMLILPLSEPLGNLLIVLAGGITSLISWIADVFAHVPFGRMAWPEGAPGVSLLIGCEMLVFVAYLLMQGHISLGRKARNIPRSPWQNTECKKPVAIVVSTLMSGFIVIVGVCGFMIPASVWINTPKNWVVVNCDVGAGQAVFLRDAETETVALLNAGGDVKALTKCLHRFNVQHIDILFLTGFGEEYTRGINAILNITDFALLPQQENSDDKQAMRLFDGAKIRYEYANVAHSGDWQPELRRIFIDRLKFTVFASEPNKKLKQSATLPLIVDLSGVRLFSPGTLKESQLSELYSQYSADALRANVSVLPDRDPTMADVNLSRKTGEKYIFTNGGVTETAKNILDIFAAEGIKYLSNGEGDRALVLQDQNIRFWSEEGSRMNN